MRGCDLNSKALYDYVSELERLQKHRHGLMALEPERTGAQVCLARPATGSASPGYVNAHVQLGGIRTTAL